MRKILIVLLSLAFLISACLPGESAAEVEARVMTSVAETIAAQGQIGTSVALTVAAQQPSATATRTPTNTPLGTFTPFATITPFTPASGGGGGSGGSGGSGTGGSGSGGAGAPQYDCALVFQKPPDGTLYKPGDTFDIVWTLKNVGTKTIPAGYPFQFIGGDDFSSTGNLTLGHDVPKNETFTFRLDAFAPQVYGREKVQFTMQWALIVEGNKICKPYIAIFVQRPGN